MGIANVILGRTLASEENEETKIGVIAGVAAMGLDGLASSAYGPEAALTILAPLGAAGLGYIGPITLVILALLTLLYFSYRQTTAAYPVNGGSYTVARENLGHWPGLLAAAALMIDYVLTVAVGISAGVAALVSAAPHLHRFTLPICLAVLLIITLFNLRGTGEAGLAFALPTYLFITMMVLVLGVGTAKAMASGGHPHPVAAPPAVPPAAQAVTLWLLLRAFASGCTAMTGVEAVSNGVSAFREPRLQHARRTLTVIVGVLAMLLAGVAYLAHAYSISAMPQDRPGYQSVLSQITAAVVGRGLIYYVTIGSVLATLCLSANTSFVDFPRLCRLIARDDCLPRSFAVVGRRLVYSVGIVFLAIAAALLLVAFRGITDKLIPLYAVGAFLAFTLSQSGMVVHWQKDIHGQGENGAGPQPSNPPGRKAHVKLWVNGVGAVATGVALIIILAAKFVEGAWIIVVTIPALLTLFKLVNRHYATLEAKTETHQPIDLSSNHPPVVLIPIRRWDRLTEKAIRFSLWLTTDVIGVHLSNLSGEEADEEERRLRDEWERDVQLPAKQHGIPPPQLVLVPTPYRGFLVPLLDEIDRTKHRYPGRVVAIVIPQVFVNHWWQDLLHRRKAGRLRAALLKKGDRHTILINVPWYVE